MPDPVAPHSDLPMSALEYELPEECIATRPAEPRDAARMLVLKRSDDRLEHRQVRDLPDYLRPGDLVVMNDTAVLPARFFAIKYGSGGKVEGLYLEHDESGDWSVMLKSNGGLRPGVRLDLLTGAREPANQSLELVVKRDDEWIVRPDPPVAPDALLERIGVTPLPPYIRRARRTHAVNDPHDRQWYQTTFADPSHNESVAAPTAGLHFTPELLDRIDASGARRQKVTLHVGHGTFKPVSAETLAGHDMHSERFHVPPNTLAALRAFEAAHTHGSGPRRIAIGTTTVRTLESLPDPIPSGHDAGMSGATDLLIAPPYEFRHVDGMLTNFHLPRSTLLALVAAMVGLDRLLEVYRVAIAEGYRFYSYGDAMLILP